MFARTTLLEIDTVRVPLDEALRQFENAVLPKLRDQPGYLGVYALTTPEGRAMLISFWETADEADASAADGWYPSVLSEFMTMFRSAPGREKYEVRIAELPLVPRPVS